MRGVAKFRVKRPSWLLPGVVAVALAALSPLLSLTPASPPTPMSSLAAQTPATAEVGSETNTRVDTVGGASGPTAPPARVARLVLSALVDGANLPGLQVAVVRDGEVLWSEGFGWADLEQRVGVTPFTRFRIGSLSKGLTAAALVRLHEEGLVDLDAPVQRWVPDFPEKGHPVTPRQLAGHLAGIRHYLEGESQLRTRSYGSVGEALEIFADDSLLHVPGTEYDYSSYGYNLLGAVVAGVSGRSYLQAMRELVFGPLDMARTVADHPDSIVPGRARFYTESEVDGRLLNAPFTNNSYKWPSGGLLSTAEELARFATSLAGGHLVGEPSLSLLFTSMTTASGDTTGYAMGWRPRTDWQGRRVLRHGGGSVGGRAFLMLYPDEGLAVAMLVNADLAPVFHEEAQTVTHLFLDRGRSSEVELDSLAGDYRFTTPRGDETVTGTLHLGGGVSGVGWMDWEGSVGAVPLVAAHGHDGEAHGHDDLASGGGREIHLMGAGAHGALNLWITFEGGALRGRWDWLGRTSRLEGTMIDGTTPTGGKGR